MRARTRACGEVKAFRTRTNATRKIKVLGQEQGLQGKDPARMMASGWGKDFRLHTSKGKGRNFR